MFGDENDPDKIPEMKLDIKRMRVNEPAKIERCADGTWTVIVEKSPLVSETFFMRLSVKDVTSSFGDSAVLRGSILPDGTLEGDLATGTIDAKRGWVENVTFKSDPPEDAVLAVTYSY